MLKNWCFNCGKLRLVKKIGSFECKGVISPIVVCQWCRAAATRRKIVNKEKRFLIRKGDE